jgi:hypothetical protein
MEIEIKVPSSLGGTWKGEELRVEEKVTISDVVASNTVSELKKKIEDVSGFKVVDQILLCQGMTVLVLNHFARVMTEIVTGSSVIF